MKQPIRVLSRLLFAITAFALSNSVQAQISPRTASPLAAKEETPFFTADSRTTSHALTATDLEAFLDGLMPAQLEREDIAGAVIAVVKDGQVLFAKGYGYSDMAKRTPITPDSTLFRPGSISKLFTWTSVMQLVEQGKLDLDRDINDYLDFKIPPAGGYSTASSPETRKLLACFSDEDV